MLRLLRCMGLLLAHHVTTWRRSNFGRFRSEADISGGGVQYRIYEYAPFCNGPDDVKPPE